MTQDNEAVNKGQLDKGLKDLSNSLQSDEPAVVYYDETGDENGSINYTSVTLGRGKDSTAVGLHNVTDCQVAENSHDAITGGQVNKIGEDAAKFLGSSAVFKEDSFTQSTYKLSHIATDGIVTGKPYEGVEKAFKGLDENIKIVNNRIKEVSEGVAQDSLSWSNESNAFVAQHGAGDAKANSKITFLANGNIAEISTDAVNGSQVYFLNQTLAAYFGGGAGYNDGKWTGPTFNVVHFKEDGTADDKKHGYNSVAEAFDGVSGSMLNINDRIRGVEKNVASNGLNWNKAEGAYDGRHNEEDSKITHVADGKVEEGSKEVVNGGQLWETNKKVTAVEDKVNTIDKKVQGVAVAADGAVKYDKDSDGKKKNRITLVGGDESAPVLIDNVGDGTIETGSKEAVNGGQLHDYTEQQMKIVLDDANKYTDERLTNAMGNVLNDVTAYTDMKFEALSYGIEDVRKEARQAAAIGLAVSNLRYNDTPGKLSVAFGTGVWLSQSAFAIGAGYTSEDGNVRSNLSVTSAGGQWGVGVGISLTLN
ncbi:Vomp family autotransporter [Bartonella sp. B39]